ncbi:MAG: hypothetical protein JWM41_2165 [Gemmatimonadetes bacterium]|nr:hypothetical protein [Gemmatimonadota bacterium]
MKGSPLAAIGGLYLIVSAAAIALWCVRGAKRGDLRLQSLAESLGLASLLLVCFIDVGVASWLVSLPFAGVYGLAEWATTQGHFPVSALIAAPFLAVGVLGAITKARARKPAPRAVDLSQKSAWPR